MDDFIEAMQIFRKYGNPRHPFQCEHDTLHVHVVKPSEVSEDDCVRLDQLGFFPMGSDEDSHWASYRYGSC